LIEDPIEACQRGIEAVTPGGTLVVCGSFFLAAETRKWLAAQASGERPSML
jgi:dihydrofolate synthase/folylpolyglutamate synthase